MMKNYKIILLAIMVFSLDACESFTEVDRPQSQLTGSSVYENAATATAALSDIYASLRDRGIASGNAQGLSILMGSYSDELQVYSNDSHVTNFYKHNVLGSDPSVSQLWSNSYSQIYAANALIERLPNSIIDNESKNQILGEALFLRAYLHFQLANLFGDIPYITTTDYSLNRIALKSAPHQVYQSAINDLLVAHNLLGETDPSGERIRANKALATALLARIYLYTEDWSNAELASQQMIDNPMYSIPDNLTETFLKDSPSVIWSLHPGLAGNNTSDAQILIFTSGPPPFAAVSPSLLAAFETGDNRKSQWLGKITNGTNTWYYPFKYRQNTNTGTSEEYTIVFRIEEQYLIRAEARAHLNKVSGAQMDLNTIRNRAGLSNTTAATEGDLITAILHERQVEFFMEQGHRWFDLRRTNLANMIIGGLKPAWQDTHVLLPLPESELLLNSNLQPQNPGY
ncbi:RagB/SusD family nutrient uptake outer membrane protein [Flavobacterium sp. WC2416]|uniref:RagB/SusD family nutrient uptake outer membrane protein n=1 Tax=Flavobacterium sp. WC2416 TaxID=3234141 RepID=A0AB39WC19_9FLAO